MEKVSALIQYNNDCILIDSYCYGEYVKHITQFTQYAEICLSIVMLKYVSYNFFRILYSAYQVHVVTPPKRDRSSWRDRSS